MKKFKNNALFLLYTIILGAIVGAIIWAFLRVMNLGIGFIWDFVPSKLGFPFYTVLVCTAGGLLTGLWKKKFGDTPEELGVVVAKVKKTNRYPYSNIFSSLVSAILPLLFGASIGPEAGLTGIIAGLCTWVGDRLKMYKKEVEELTQIGLSATLGTIFRSPMFGFFEPLEDERDAVIPKASKIVLYIAAILSSFGAFILLGRLLGGSGGIEGLEPGTPSWYNYVWAVPLTLAGIAAGYIYYIFRKLTHLYESKLKKLTVTRAVIGGLLLGISGTFLPLTMFSGEHQISIAAADKHLHKLGAKGRSLLPRHLLRYLHWRGAQPVHGRRYDILYVRSNYGACRLYAEKARRDRAFAYDSIPAEVHPGNALRRCGCKVHTAA